MVQRLLAHAGPIPSTTTSHKTQTAMYQGLPTQDPEVSTFILEVEDAQRDRSGHLLKATQVNRQNWDSTPNLAESTGLFSRTSQEGYESVPVPAFASFMRYLTFWGGSYVPSRLSITMLTK